MSDALEQARTRREELRVLLIATEAALAAPVAGSGWQGRVSDSLESVSKAWDAHIEATEGEEALFAEVIEQAPRLSFTIERLRADHRSLGNSLRAALYRLGDDDPDDPYAIREEILGLLGRFARHRQLGADLIYDAYNLELGPGD